MMKGKTIKVGNEFLLTDFFITHESNGITDISFEVNNDEKAYREAIVENSVIYNGQRFTIKSVEDNGPYAIVNGTLDLDDFKANIIKEIGKEDEPLQLSISEVFKYKPDGWSMNIINERNSKSELNARLITFYDLFLKIPDMFGVFYEINNIDKQITVRYIEDINYTGMYVTEQLNIVSSSYQADTYDFFTRLYVYGKDENGNEVNISGVNNGKEYVEDFTYSSKIISSVLELYDISDPIILKETAIRTLKEHALPASSYNFKVSSLGTNDYALFDIGVNKVVKYLDRKHKQEIMHRIVQYVEHPNNPSSDEITLATLSTTIENQIIINSNTVAGDVSANELMTFLSTGSVRFDKNSLIVCNKTPLTNATGILMFDKFGLWWNSQYKPHVLDSKGEISSTTWKKIIDINTGSIV